VMNASAPDGASCVAENDGNLPKRSCPAVPRRGPEAGNHRNIMDFHASGKNSRSWAFQQIQFPSIIHRYSQGLSGGRRPASVGRGEPELSFRNKNFEPGSLTIHSTLFDG